MQLTTLIERLQDTLRVKGDLVLSDIFRNDFGDELVLEAPGPEFTRTYIAWDNYGEDYGPGSEEHKAALEN